MAYQQRLDVYAHNTANLQTENFRPQESRFQENNPGVSAQITQSLSTENVIENNLVGSIATQSVYTANLSMLKVQDSLLGTLLDIKA